MTDSTWELLSNPEDERHGTINGYVNHMCRCDLCTDANTEEQQKQRSKRALREPPPESHGTPSCYVNWKCRRPECREAYNAEARARRARQKQEAGK